MLQCYSQLVGTFYGNYISTFFENEFFLSDSLNFLFLLIGLTIISHIPLILGHNLSKRGWKKVDYTWLFIAVIGLMGAVSEVRTYVASNYFEGEKRIASSTLGSLKFQSINIINSSWCLSNKEYKVHCDWFRETTKYLDSIESKNAPELVLKNYPLLTEEHLFFDIFKQFKSVELIYKSDRVKFIKTSSAIGKSEFERTIWYLGPFLLCFALAIRVTKVTGEILLENKT